MSNVYTRVTCTLEVPFIQRNRIHLFFSLFLHLLREIFFDQKFLIVNTEVLRHCHNRWKFMQVQCTLLEYILYPSIFCQLVIYVHCYYYLLRHTLHHSAPSILRVWLKVRQTILWTNFTSREEQPCTQHIQVLDLAYQRDRDSSN